jgi:hypothetical protein
MFGDNRVAGRPVGVGQTSGQRGTSVGGGRRLTNIARSEEYAVEWVDDDGNSHLEIMHRVGGVWHRAPNGENYAAQLKAVSSTSWLVKLLEERIAGESTTSIPKEDAVDVLGDGATDAPIPAVAVEKG